MALSHSRATAAAGRASGGDEEREGKADEPHSQERRLGGLLDDDSGGMEMEWVLLSSANMSQRSWVCVRRWL